MIPKNIAREHIEKAIEEIEIYGIRKGRHSSTYDLVFNNKTYPPKLVISIANRYANGEELDPNSFEGGKGTEAFKSLEDAGFLIIEKTKSGGYEIVSEYIKQIKSGSVYAANSIKLLVDRNNFEENIKIVDRIFLEEKLKIIDSTNYRDIISYLLEKHKISSGDYNDFNIWSASKSFLNDVNPSLVVRHEELNNLVGFPDNGNGLYKSFLGRKNLISFLENKFQSAKTIQYWLYSPGENARNWEEFHTTGIMALGWDDLEDLRQYKNREEIKKALTRAYGGEGSKKNDVSANDDFVNKINVGDIIIVKKGRNELLGYGVVNSDYVYDETRSNFRSIRMVDWKLKGSWQLDFSLVIKTLTDITSYSSDHPDYDTYHERLMGEMKSNKQLKNIAKMSLPLNTIFYGPPGTGKTYHTVLRAAEIINGGKVDSYNHALEIFKSNLNDRIEFITFHQNYSYEDFIQGLRPETANSSSLVFEKKDGVFKRIADRALQNLEQAEKSPDELISDARFNEALDIFTDMIMGSDDNFKINDTAYIFNVEEDAFRYTGNRWTNHVNGLRMKKSDLREFYRNNVSNRKDIKKLTTISGLASQHATYFYLVYTEILKLLPEITETAQKVSAKNYVIIIDEINRANISRVFGELITLIEPDKRSHGAIPLEAKLPSGDRFIVPSNLFIVGTMNTADKSIALLDIALRRRFEFEPMYPKYSIDGQEIYDLEILKKINEQVIKLKGHDFQIGHAYFMGENQDLLERMNKKVIPLLLEYFMNDEKEVREILKTAGLSVDESSWPLRILGKND